VRRVGRGLIGHCFLRLHDLGVQVPSSPRSALLGFGIIPQHGIKRSCICADCLSLANLDLSLKKIRLGLTMAI
jgi:hypothetical protein